MSSRLTQYLSVAFFLIWGIKICAQTHFTIPHYDKRGKVPFKLVSNLIVIPVVVNGDTLSFILDTGVAVPVVFNYTHTDSTVLRRSKKIELVGLGGNEIVEAYESKGNQISIGNAYKAQQTLYLIYDKQINSLPRLGMPIHGIIGYDFFKDFVVKVNYIRQNLIFYPPDKAPQKKCRRCVVKDIRLVDRKPFISALVSLEGETGIETNLLMDTGSSDALWLFESESIQVPEKHFYDYLGKGLSGHMYGNRAKLKAFLLDKYLLRNPTVAFPDSISLIGLDTTFIKRHGSVGGEILKRFNWVFDYSENKVYFRKNANFSMPFEYNMSGIEIEHNGFQLVQELNNGKKSSLTDSNNTRLNVVFETTYRLELKPSYRIASIRKGSPADLAGLQPGDVLVSINQIPVHRYSLDKLNALLFEKEGKKMTIRVLRNHFHYEFQFHLQPMF